MKTVARSIATKIKETDREGTHSIEVMEYSLTILLNTLFIIVISLVIGWLTNELVSTLIAICSILVIRIVSGGPHIKSMWGCNIFSVLLCTVIPHVPILIPIFILNIISAVIMLIFSPRPDDNAKMPRKYFPYLKVISVALVCSNFFVNNDVIALAFFIQAITIITFGKEEKA